VPGASRVTCQRIVRSDVGRPTNGDHEVTEVESSCLSTHATYSSLLPTAIDQARLNSRSVPTCRYCFHSSRAPGA